MPARGDDDDRARRQDGDSGQQRAPARASAGALERVDRRRPWTATGRSSFKYFVDSDQGEAHGRLGVLRWWVNGKSSELGVCDAELLQGDEVLFYVVARAPVRVQAGDRDRSRRRDRDRCRPPSLAGPTTASTGQPRRRDGSSTGDSGAHRRRRAGATVSDGAAAVTTGARRHRRRSDAGGHAARLRATERRRRCVTPASDGTLRYERRRRAAPPTVSRRAPDARRAPRRRSRSAMQQRVRAGRGPRTLSGHVRPAPRALRDSHACASRARPAAAARRSSGAPRALRAPARCGAARGVRSAIGDRADWSYLLPGAPAARALRAATSMAVDRPGLRHDDRAAAGGSGMVFRVA